MSYIKISELSSANTIIGTEKILLLQGGETKSANSDLIKSYIQSGNLRISSSSFIESVSTNTGALVVNGGIGTNGRVNADRIRCNSTAQSNQPNAGSLIVNGGVGIGSGLNSGAFALSVNGRTTLAGVDSTSTNTGALVITGGIGLGGSINVQGGIKINSGQISSSASNGALVVTGGVGISDSLNIGNDLYVENTTNIANRFSVSSNPIIPDSSIFVKVDGDIYTTGASWANIVKTSTLEVNGASGGIITSASNISLNPGPQSVVKIGNNEVATKNYIDSAVQGSAGTNLNKVGTTLNLNNNITLTGNINSYAYDQGTLIVTGGIGVSENIIAGGRVEGNSVFANSISTENLNIYNSDIWDSGAGNINLGPSSGHSVIIAPGAVLSGVESMSGLTPTSSTSNSTGALVVNGGVGISGNLNVGSNLNAGGKLYTNRIEPTPGEMLPGNYFFRLDYYSGLDADNPDPEQATGFRIMNTEGIDCLRVSGVGRCFSRGYFVHDGSQYFSVPKTYKTNIGNGLSTTFTITHNLNTRDVMVSVYRDSATPSPGYDTINTSTNQINRINDNQIQLTFSSPPPTTTGAGAGLSGGYRVVIMG